MNNQLKNKKLIFLFLCLYHCLQLLKKCKLDKVLGAYMHFCHCLSHQTINKLLELYFDLFSLILIIIVSIICNLNRFLIIMGKITLTKIIPNLVTIITLKLIMMIN